MPWPTWYQALIAALVATAVAGLLPRLWPRSRTTGVAVPAAREFALIAVLYSLWRIARKLPLARDEGAIERARAIVEVQNALWLPSELSLQRFVADHDPLGWVLSAYYAGLHVPGLVAFLVWLWVRHREAFPHWRNALAFVTAGCLVIRYLRVAPPRMLVDMGFVDLAAAHGFDLYGPVGTGVSDQFAAMPSIHVAWAAVVSFGAVSVSRSPWRWVVGAHVVVTTFAVAATGNHWWLDGLVAVAILVVGLWLDGRWRRRTTLVARGRTDLPIAQGDARPRATRLRPMARTDRPLR